MMRSVKFFYFIFVLMVFCSRLESFDQVVIWGHKLHTHTHSYIHNAFYIAFKHLGYETFWLDENSDVSDFDFSNTLFLTEGQVDTAIPLRDDCLYILHNCSPLKYSSIKPQNQIKIQVYTDDILSVSDAVKIAPCIYQVLSDRCLYMPWATDLLPHEIDEVKKSMQETPVEKRVHWIGTIGGGEFGNINQLNPFKMACEENGIEFIQKSNVELDINKQLIQSSYMAPTLVGEWQMKKGYIPCRIFKNISYGKMGITNSQRVYELFEGKVVFNADSYQLFYDAREAMKAMTQQQLYDLMDFVKTKHTYINRIDTILDFFKLVQSSIDNQSSLDLDF